MRWHCALALLPLLLYAQEDVLRPRGAPVFEPWTEARTPIRLGLEGGISWNSASQSINYAGVQPTPPTPMDIFKSGSGISPAAAAAVDIGIAPKLGLQFKLGYEQKKWSNSGTRIADCGIFWQLRKPRERAIALHCPSQLPRHRCSTALRPHPPTVAHRRTRIPPIAGQGASDGEIRT
jgi:hypothetical protein